MARLTQSYANGTSTVPLIGDTIGKHFEDAASASATATRLSSPTRMSAGPTPSST